MEDTIVAGSDLDAYRHRVGWDVGFPPMPHRTFPSPPSLCETTKFLLTFQGRATHGLRLNLSTLHDEKSGVIIRVICMYEGQSEHCLDMGDNTRAVKQGEEEDGNTGTRA